MNLALLWLYLPIGGVIGFIAGLLGVGGGAILVPAFLLAAHAEGFPPAHTMHMALGTSLACILVSSLSSMRAHHRRGAVNQAIVRQMIAPIFLGSLSGTFIAAALPATPLKCVFLAFLIYVGQDMLRRPDPAGQRGLPGLFGMALMGGVIGVFSALVGIGGASLTVAFLVLCSVGMHEAIGTSAALGFPIALAGALGYAINGWGVAGLPAGSLGFVYLPAVAGVTMTSMLTAPLGARTAHALPVPMLRRIFAGVLLTVAAKMAWGLLNAG